MRGMLFLILLASGAALAEPLAVESRTMAWKAGGEDLPFYAGNWAAGSIKMPYVVSAASGIAARINDTLYLSLLGTPAPLKPGKTFSLADGASPEGTSSLDFSVRRNDDQIIEILVSGESCGAYCEGYEREFSFDAHTGRVLSSEDLLTAQGISVVAQRMLEERRRRYANQIKSLKQELKTLSAKTPKGKKPDASDTEDRLAFNESCLADEKQKSRDEVYVTGFALPAGKGMVFTSERCSNHASLALDDVLNVELAIPPAELRDLLTPYGKSLVLGEGKAPGRLASFGQILHGKIGTATITLQLGRPSTGGAMSALYYYERYRKPISLSGELKGERMELVEKMTEQGQATLSLSRNGAAYVGQWSANGKQLPVTLGW
jgi:hypothetical protein